MDWDVPPTTFSEYVTIRTNGATGVLATTDNGFDTVNPLQPSAPILFTGEADDSGPTDHGALFDFGFGTLAPGEDWSFTLFFGAADDRTDALSGLSTVGAEVYSLGMPSSVTPPDGQPNPFLFGARGVGGSPIQQQTTVAAEAPSSSRSSPEPQVQAPLVPAPQNAAHLP
jgi:hypothetical protein